MFNWKYQNPVKIHFGTGMIENLSKINGSQKTIIITTPGSTKRGITNLLKKLLGNTLVAVFDDVQPNPTFSSIKASFKEVQQYNYETIIAVGGGSVIDTAKAVSASVSSGSEFWLEDHLKNGEVFPEKFLPKPIIAVPTTSGTGSEVTMWATIWDMDEKKKYSLSNRALYPRIALLDPQLTVTLPQKETVYSGLDALSHAMESIWNKNNNPVSNVFAIKAIEMVYKYLPELCQVPDNIALRSQLHSASLFAGLAFSNTKTALAHSISYPLTAHFNVPHGLACAFTLPALIAFNAEESKDDLMTVAKTLGFTSIDDFQIGMIGFYKVIGVGNLLKEFISNVKDMLRFLPEMISTERAGNNLRYADIGDVEKIITNSWEMIFG